MSRRPIVPCDLMSRLREPREIRRRRFRYYRARLRMCQGEAVALVKFADRAEPLELCARHLEREVLDGARGIEWFEELHLSRRTKPPRDRAAALELAEKYCLNRAPTERSWESLDTRERKRLDRSA